MGEKIRIELSDWQFNAGIVGFYNVLSHAGDKIIISEQYIEFDKEVLIDFNDKYFEYLIQTYEKVTNYFEIQNKLKLLLTLEEGQKTDIYEKYLKEINTKLDNAPYRDIRKKIARKHLNAKNINRTILEKLEGMLGIERNTILKRELIGYYNQQTGKSSVPKAVIDKHVNTNMLNIPKICKNVEKYINVDKTKFKIKCFICKNKIKKIGKGLNFLLNTYFDTDRKTSHIWNLSSDIEICPICEFVYYCVPAGFITVYGKGLFINNNNSVRDLINTNTILKTEVTGMLNQKNNSLTYKSLINAINKQKNSKVQYELQDIQIIGYDNDKYRFNILSKEVLRIIRESEKQLNSLINSIYVVKRKSTTDTFRIYDNVIENILNNYNMFTLIHKLLIFKITDSESITTYYNMKHIMDLIIININYLKGVEGMDKSKENKELVKGARMDGLRLRREYFNNDNDKEKSTAKAKIKGISYRLLNALKTKNSEMFMHNIVTSYMYMEKTIPSILTMALEDEDELGIIGYAFVTGLNGWDPKTENVNGGKNDEN